MNRLLFEAGELDGNACVRLNDRRSEHLLRVLKVVPGQCLRAGVLEVSMGKARVIEIGPAGVRLEYAPVSDIPPDSGMDLLLAMPRPKGLKRLWPQLAALGTGTVWITGGTRVEKWRFRVCGGELYWSGVIGMG